MKTLVVEDTLTTQMVFNEQLSAYGQCTAVSSGAEAIEEFQELEATRHNFHTESHNLTLTGQCGGCYRGKDA